MLPVNYKYKYKSKNTDDKYKQRCIWRLSAVEWHGIHFLSPGAPSPHLCTRCTIGKLSQYKYKYKYRKYKYKSRYTQKKCKTTNTNEILHLIIWSKCTIGIFPQYRCKYKYKLKKEAQIQMGALTWFMRLVHIMFTLCYNKLHVKTCTLSQWMNIIHKVCTVHAYLLHIHTSTNTKINSKSTKYKCRNTPPLHHRSP